MSDLKKIEEWFKAVKPNPTRRDFEIQLGCHFEEVMEMVDALFTSDLGLAEKVYDALSSFSSGLKDGSITVHGVRGNDLLDAMRDQCVTGVGVDYMAGADVSGAQDEVNRSNWSKFENGGPVFDGNGKVRKGRDYSPPDLEPFIGVPLWEAMK